MALGGKLFSVATLEQPLLWAPAPGKLLHKFSIWLRSGELAGHSFFFSRNSGVLFTPVLGCLGGVSWCSVLDKHHQCLLKKSLFLVHQYLIFLREEAWPLFQVFSFYSSLPSVFASKGEIAVTSRRNQSYQPKSSTWHCLWLDVLGELGSLTIPKRRHFSGCED